MSLTFTIPFVGTPAFYTGTSSSSLVPDVFPVAINGRPYLIDSRSGKFSRQLDQRVRDSQDTSTAPASASTVTVGATPVPPPAEVASDGTLIVIPDAGSVPCEHASIAGVPNRVFVTNSARY